MALITIHRRTLRPGMVPASMGGLAGMLRWSVLTLVSTGAAWLVWRYLG